MRYSPTLATLKAEERRRLREERHQQMQMQMGGFGLGLAPPPPPLPPRCGHTSAPAAAQRLAEIVGLAGLQYRQETEKKRPTTTATVSPAPPTAAAAAAKAGGKEAQPQPHATQAAATAATKAERRKAKAVERQRRAKERAAAIGSIASKLQIPPPPKHQDRTLASFASADVAPPHFIDMACQYVVSENLNHFAIQAPFAILNHSTIPLVIAEDVERKRTKRATKAQAKVEAEAMAALKRTLAEGILTAEEQRAAEIEKEREKRRAASASTTSAMTSVAGVTAAKNTSTTSGGGGGEFHSGAQMSLAKPKPKKAAAAESPAGDVDDEDDDGFDRPTGASVLPALCPSSLQMANYTRLPAAMSIPIIATPVLAPDFMAKLYTEVLIESEDDEDDIEQHDAEAMLMQGFGGGGGDPLSVAGEDGGDVKDVAASHNKKKRKSKGRRWVFGTRGPIPLHAAGTVGQITLEPLEEIIDRDNDDSDSDSSCGDDDVPTAAAAVDVSSIATTTTATTVTRTTTSESAVADTTAATQTKKESDKKKKKKKKLPAHVIRGQRTRTIHLTVYTHVHAETGTMLVEIVPRWTIINRTPWPLTVSQHTLLPDTETVDVTVGPKTAAPMMFVAKEADQHLKEEAFADATKKASGAFPSAPYQVTIRRASPPPSTRLAKGSLYRGLATPMPIGLEEVTDALVALPETVGYLGSLNAAYEAMAKRTLRRMLPPTSPTTAMAAEQQQRPSSRTPQAANASASDPLTAASPLVVARGGSSLSLANQQPTADTATSVAAFGSLLARTDSLSASPPTTTGADDNDDKETYAKATATPSPPACATFAPEEDLVTVACKGQRLPQHNRNSEIPEGILLAPVADEDDAITNEDAKLRAAASPPSMVCFDALSPPSAVTVSATNASSSPSSPPPQQCGAIPNACVCGNGGDVDVLSPKTASSFSRTIGTPFIDVTTSSGNCGGAADANGRRRQQQLMPYPPPPNMRGDFASALPPPQIQYPPTQLRVSVFPSGPRQFLVIEPAESSTFLLVNRTPYVITLMLPTDATTNGAMRKERGAMGDAKHNNGKKKSSGGGGSFSDEEREKKKKKSQGEGNDDANSSDSDSDDADKKAKATRAERKRKKREAKAAKDGVTIVAPNQLLPMQALVRETTCTRVGELLSATVLTADANIGGRGQGQEGAEDAMDERDRARAVWANSAAHVLTVFPFQRRTFALSQSSSNDFLTSVEMVVSMPPPPMLSTIAEAMATTPAASATRDSSVTLPPTSGAPTDDQHRHQGPPAALSASLFNAAPMSSATPQKRQKKKKATTEKGLARPSTRTISSAAPLPPDDSARPYAERTGVLSSGDVIRGLSKNDLVLTDHYFFTQEARRAMAGKEARRAERSRRLLRDDDTQQLPPPPLPQTQSPQMTATTQQQQHAPLPPIIRAFHIPLQATDGTPPQSSELLRLYGTAHVRIAQASMGQTIVEVLPWEVEGLVNEWEAVEGAKAALAVAEERRKAAAEAERKRLRAERKEKRHAERMERRAKRAARREGRAFADSDNNNNNNNSSSASATPAATTATAGNSRSPLPPDAAAAHRRAAQHADAANFVSVAGGVGGKKEGPSTPRESNSAVTNSNAAAGAYSSIAHGYGSVSAASAPRHALPPLPLPRAENGGSGNGGALVFRSGSSGATSASGAAAPLASPRFTSGGSGASSRAITVVSVADDSSAPTGPNAGTGVPPLGLPPLPPQQQQQQQQSLSRQPSLTALSRAPTPTAAASSVASSASSLRGMNDTENDEMRNDNDDNDSDDLLLATLYGDAVGRTLRGNPLLLAAALAGTVSNNSDGGGTSDGKETTTGSNSAITSPHQPQTNGGSFAAEGSEEEATAAVPNDSSLCAAAAEALLLAHHSRQHSNASATSGTGACTPNASSAFGFAAGGKGTVPRPAAKQPPLPIAGRVGGQIAGIGAVAPALNSTTAATAEATRRGYFKLSDFPQTAHTDACRVLRSVSLVVAENAGSQRSRGTATTTATNASDDITSSLRAGVGVGVAALKGSASSLTSLSKRGIRSVAEAASEVSPLNLAALPHSTPSHHRSASHSSAAAAAAATKKKKRFSKYAIVCPVVDRPIDAALNITYVAVSIVNQPREIIGGAIVDLRARFERCERLETVQLSILNFQFDNQTEPSPPYQALLFPIRARNAPPAVCFFAQQRVLPIKNTLHFTQIKMEVAPLATRSSDVVLFRLLEFRQRLVDAQRAAASKPSTRSAFDGYEGAAAGGGGGGTSGYKQQQQTQGSGREGEQQQRSAGQGGGGVVAEADDVDFYLDDDDDEGGAGAAVARHRFQRRRAQEIREFDRRQRAATQQRLQALLANLLAAYQELGAQQQQQQQQGEAALSSTTNAQQMLLGSTAGGGGRGIGLDLWGTLNDTCAIGGGRRGEETASPPFAAASPYPSPSSQQSPSAAAVVGLGNVPASPPLPHVPPSPQPSINGSSASPYMSPAQRLEATIAALNNTALMTAHNATIRFDPLDGTLKLHSTATNGNVRNGNANGSVSPSAPHTSLPVSPSAGGGAGAAFTSACASASSASAASAGGGGRRCHDPLTASPASDDEEENDGHPTQNGQQPMLTTASPLNKRNKARDADSDDDDDDEVASVHVGRSAETVTSSSATVGGGHGLFSFGADANPTLLLLEETIRNLSFAAGGGGGGNRPSSATAATRATFGTPSVSGSPPLGQQQQPASPPPTASPTRCTVYGGGNRLNRSSISSGGGGDFGATFIVREANAFAPKRRAAAAAPANGGANASSDSFFRAATAPSAAAGGGGPTTFINNSNSSFFGGLTFAGSGFDGGGGSGGDNNGDDNDFDEFASYFDHPTLDIRDYAKTHRHPTDADVYEAAPRSSGIMRAQCTIESMAINPFVMRVWFERQRDNASQDVVQATVAQNALLSHLVTSIEDVKISVPGLTVTSQNGRLQSHVNRFTNFYIGGVIKQMAGILLSFASQIPLVGAPIKLISGIGSSTVGFFEDAVDMSSPDAMAVALARSTAAFAGNVFGGAIVAVSSIFTSGAKLAAIAAGERNDEGRPMNTIDGIVKGVTGIVVKPMRGAAEEGKTGLGAGLGQGLVGFVAAPISGLLGDIGRGARFVGAAISADTQHISEIGRLRPIRQFYPGGAVAPLGAFVEVFQFQRQYHTEKLFWSNKLLPGDGPAWRPESREDVRRRRPEMGIEAWFVDRSPGASFEGWTYDAKMSGNFDRPYCPKVTHLRRRRWVIVMKAREPSCVAPHPHDVLPRFVVAVGAIGTDNNNGANTTNNNQGNGAAPLLLTAPSATATTNASPASPIAASPTPNEIAAASIDTAAELTELLSGPSGGAFAQQRRMAAARRALIGADKANFNINEAPTVEVIEVFENQRYFPLAGWTSKLLPSDRAQWSDREGHKVRERHQYTLEEGWEWTEEWRLLDLEVEKTGTGYESDDDAADDEKNEKNNNGQTAATETAAVSSLPPTSSSALSATVDPLTGLSDAELGGGDGGWYYAFDFRGYTFRRGHRAVDCVRRRCWRRTMKRIGIKRLTAGPMPEPAVTDHISKD